MSERWLRPAGRGADLRSMFGYVRRGEAARIRARFGGHLVDVRGGVSRAAEEFDVPTFDALLRLAEEFGTKISRIPDPRRGSDTFFVDDGERRYRYRAAARRGRGRAVVSV